MTSAEDRRALLEIARAVVRAFVRGEQAPDCATPGSLDRRAGAFVSLHREGRLRGCVGHIEADRYLHRVVADCARAACSEDPRFPVVVASELPDLDIELSILGPLELVKSPDAVEIGRHGLLVEMGRHRGLLLPQVAVEWRWLPSQFVEHTCHKAGLPNDAWQNGATLWRFEAEVFGDERSRTPTD